MTLPFALLCCFLLVVAVGCLVLCWEAASRRQTKSRHGAAWTVTDRSGDSRQLQLSETSVAVGNR